MTRDVHGKPVRHADEGVKASKGEDKKEAKKEHESAEEIKPKLDKHAEILELHHETLGDHHDRLGRIEEHLGIAKQEDAFKHEDQGGKYKVGPFHETMEKARQPERKRH